MMGGVGFKSRGESENGLNASLPMYSQTFFALTHRNGLFSRDIIFSLTSSTYAFVRQRRSYLFEKIKIYKVNCKYNILMLHGVSC